MDAAVPTTRQDHSALDGRSYATNQVWLNVYDITFFNDALLPLLGIGVFHSAIEVFGSEFGYGRNASGPGVFAIEPQSYPGHVYRESFALGATALSERDVFRVFGRMNALWSGRSYDMLRRNCSHFAHDFGKMLCTAPDVKAVNDWIDGELVKLEEKKKKQSKSSPGAAATTRDGYMSASNSSIFVWNPPQFASTRQPHADGDRVMFAGGVSVASAVCCCGCDVDADADASEAAYEQRFPAWVNRIVRVAQWLLPSSAVRAIENQDRKMAGMPLMTEEDEKEVFG